DLVERVICFRSCIFFFSSRRRHTRCYRDWSSDVCSSDLPHLELERDRQHRCDEPIESERIGSRPEVGETRMHTLTVNRARAPCQIGRASCRERVEMWESEGAVKKT